MSSDDSSEIDPDYKKCIFYFKYQMRVEFIPHVEEEIIEFLTMAQKTIPEPVLRQPILVVLNKRIKDIDRFFQNNWTDYRTQQILRSRKLLVDFIKKHHSLLAIKKDIIRKPESQPIQAYDRYPQNGHTLHRDSPRETIVQVMNRSKQKQYPRQQERTFKYSNEKSTSPNVEQRAAGKNQPVTPRYVKPTVQERHPAVTPRDIKTAEKSAGKGLLTPSREEQEIKVKTKSVKVIPKMSPTMKKMTKEEYIAYLRNKKTQ